MSWKLCDPFPGKGEEISWLLPSFVKSPEVAAGLTLAHGTVVTQFRAGNLGSGRGLSSAPAPGVHSRLCQGNLVVFQLLSIGMRVLTLGEPRN